MRGTPKKFHFGVDAWVDKKISREELKRILLELVKLMGMKKLTEPLIVEGKTFAGYTGFIVIEESHIAFHHFSTFHRIWFDLLSCKGFRKKDILDYLKKELGIKYCRYF